MIDKHTLKTMVRGGYDIQKLRIETGNRLVANFRAKLGLEPGEKPEELPSILYDLKRRFRKITDGVAEITRRRKFEYDGVISNYTELVLVGHYLALEKNETRIFRELGYALDAFPIWTEFLKDVKGCGPAMASVIISEIDIEKARYPSSLWKYSGLDVADDGRGRSRQKAHLVDVEYENSNGEMDTRKSITFNPFLKTKLTGVLGSSFLRAGSDDNPYRKIYDDYKHRIENSPRHEEKSKGHRHNMAIRYMIKQFLIDLYTEWRGLEGLPVAPPYHEAKLGITHSS